jgi:hypothetical protein
MNKIGTTDRQHIKHFVRESLGCTCPEEVFENIRVADHLDQFTSASIIYEIGERLLVAVLVPADWRDTARQLGQLVDAGMQYRDRHGYNRFRLVIATVDGDAINRLQSDFEALTHKDEKVHLHVIKPELLPLDVPA